MILPFGKHAGKSLSEVPDKYITWLYEYYNGNRIPHNIIEAEYNKRKSKKTRGRPKKSNKFIALYDNEQVISIGTKTEVLDEVLSCLEDACVEEDDFHRIEVYELGATVQHTLTVRTEPQYDFSF